MACEKVALVLGTRVTIKKEGSCWDGQEGIIDAVFEHPNLRTKLYGVHFAKQSRVICFTCDQLEVD
jgi:hypothetical protein